jgi:hypothetical protein
MVMLEGLRKYLKVKRATDSNNTYSDADAKLSWWDHTKAVQELFEPTAGRALQQEKSSALRAHDMAKAGTEVLVQPTLKDGQALLALGPLVHTTMWCRELMPENNPRVILNCKIAGTKELRRGKEMGVEGCPATGSWDPVKWEHVDYSAQRQLINRISAQSLLYQLYVGPSSESLYTGQQGQENVGISEHYLSQREVEALATEYALLCLRSEAATAKKEEAKQVA